jgi:hypothetical protein
MKTTTIGLDLAKSVFQVHGVDAAGQFTLRKKLRRSELLRFFEALSPCLVGVERSRFYVTNLTNAVVRTSVNESVEGFSVQGLVAPRIFGVQLEYKWQ